MRRWATQRDQPASRSRFLKATAREIARPTWLAGAVSNFANGALNRNATYQFTHASLETRLAL